MSWGGCLILSHWSRWEAQPESKFSFLAHSYPQGLSLFLFPLLSPHISWPQGCSLEAGPSSVFFAAMSWSVFRWSLCCSWEHRGGNREFKWQRLTNQTLSSVYMRTPAPQNVGDVASCKFWRGLIFAYPVLPPGWFLLSTVLNQT